MVPPVPTGSAVTDGQHCTRGRRVADCPGAGRAKHATGLAAARLPAVHSIMGLAEREGAARLESLPAPSRVGGDARDEHKLRRARAVALVAQAGAGRLL